ncbi:general secretion pathway protein GspL [Sphingosinicella humi]|uniref:General secretion pathway protein GspL n=1 Tax=Allosphingosinicella humi TaxID=2068657 RepID=A0A2U2IZK3_9SPHN|nr:general secretion pathway protein GspL [Sphingosinicella humi]
MSVSDVLLIFLGRREGVDGWLRLRDGAVVARGTGLEGLPDLADPLRIVAAVPGDAVAIHRFELPEGLAPAQAAAAARLMAAEVSAQPVSEMHVAVGAGREGDALRLVALVPALAMADWLGRLQAQGLDPDSVIPEPLLLTAPDEGFRRYDRGELPLYRGRNEAFSIEPDLAALVVGDAPVETIGDEAFERGLGDTIAAPAVDLRQGAFAKRRRWAIDWKRLRRTALVAAGILLLTLAIQIASIFRYTFAADALEAEAAEVAAGVLPGSGPVTDPARQLDSRLAQLGGGGAGFDTLASGLIAGIRATPNVQLTALVFDREGSLRATVQGDTPAAFSALEQRIEASGFEVDVGPARSGGGQPTAELTVRAS